MELEASVIGLGNLGVCLAASLGYRGIPTVGIDIDEEIVNQVGDGVAPTDEPDLQRYFDEMAEGNLRTTTNAAAVKETDVSFLFVNTPSDDDGRYSLDAVLDAARDVGEQLAEMDDYHLVVLRSTVVPGDTGGAVREILEDASGKQAGEKFGLVYCPEFTAVGNVIEGMETPDFFLIGEHDERAGNTLEVLYREWVPDPAPVVHTDLVSAELAKMAINTYISMKISFANNLAQVCDGIGGHVDEVTRAITNDSRINGAYLGAGTRFGGPCFPRDNVAFSNLAREAGTRAPLARATDEINADHTEWIGDAIREITPEGGRVTILGMSYKPDVEMIVESQGVKLVEELGNEFDLVCYESALGERLGDELAADVGVASSIDEALDRADTAVITTLADEFAEASHYDQRGLAIVDPWRTLSAANLDSSVTYVPIGARRAPKTR